MLNVWRVTINHSISDKMGGTQFYCYSCGDEIWSSHHMPTPSHHHQGRPCQLVASYHLHFIFILWLMVMVQDGMFGYSKIDLFTIEGWQSCVFFTSHDHPHMCWVGTARLRLDWLRADNTSGQNLKTMIYVSSYVACGAVVRPLVCCNYNPEI